MTRPVDDAMAEDRPEKMQIRSMWIAEVEASDHAGPEPVYLTLCGKSATEIEMLIERGLMTRSETGAITSGGDRYVAVESSPDAVFYLQDKYPGLKILGQNIRDLLRSENFMTWPNKDMRKFVRAKIVNLDLNQSLGASVTKGQVRFADLEIVDKIARLHGHEEPLDWQLFVTLNAQINWKDPIATAVLTFLRENFLIEPRFEARCGEVLDEEVMDIIRTGDAARALQLDMPGAQQLLMAFVPKKVAHMAHAHGWLVSTERNLHYGGTGDAASMVTWMFRFTWDPRTASEPQQVYREALATVLEHAGRIDPDGSVVAV